MTRCSGPCLPHCFRTSPIVTLLAYASLVHTLACVGYLLLTRNIGTPFHDSLTEEQIEIERRSAKQRAEAFYTSAAASGVLLLLWRPLR